MNIFEKDFLIIPIHKHVHWFLAIVCYPNLKEPILSDGNNVHETRTEKNEPIISNDKVDETEIASKENADETVNIAETSSKPISSTSFYSNTRSSISSKLNTDQYKIDPESADEAEGEDSNDAYAKVDKIRELEGKSFEKMYF